jgi:molecular chaperone GrpE
MNPDLASTEAETDPPPGPACDQPPPADHGAGVPPVEPSTGGATEPPYVARLDEALAAVLHQLASEAERAAFRERVVDRQHAEIERLRSAERSGLLRPVITDLCGLRNNLLRQAGTVPETMSPRQVSILLGSFADLVADALERCGVAAAAPTPGTAFVPGQQQVVGTVEVTDAALDGTVACVLQDGYSEIDGGKIVLPARITINRVAATAAAQGRTAHAGTKEQTDD